MPEGNLKFKILPEREIQIFFQTNLVTKTARGEGQQFHLTRNKQPRWGVWIVNEFHEGLSLDIYTIGKIMPKGIYTPFNHNTHKSRNKMDASKNTI